MNNFREILNNLRDTFMQLPLPTRVIGSSMVVLIAMGFWMLASGVGTTTTKERLFNSDSLTDDEITKALSAFSSARLNDWAVERNRIYVPSEARAEYYRAAEAADALPLREGTILGKIQEQTSPFYSDSSRQSRENHGKEQDLGKRIAAFPQVLRASVEHDIMRQGFSANTKQSASVVVTPIGAEPLAGPMVREIRRLVAASYAGLNEEDVVVTDVNSRGLSALEEENPLLAARIKHEEYFTRKAQILLQPFGPLSIDATVEIDPTMESELAKLAYDQQPTTLQETSASNTMESTRPMPSGVPGTATNALGNSPTQLDPNANQISKSTQKSEATMKVTGEQYEASRLASFLPKRVSYSVGVPESYYETIWRDDFFRNNPLAKAEDLKPMTIDERARLKQDTASKIQSALTPVLLPVEAGEDKFPLIEVWDHRDLPSLPMEQPSSTAIAMSWLAQYWQTIGLFVLAVVALFFARRVGKMGAGAPRTDFEEGFGLDIPKPPEEEEMLEEGETGPRLTITGQQLKQELSQLVGTNPEAAANVLRNWLERPSAA